MSSRIDVSIEHRNVPEPPDTKHPNTCPDCDSHYRDDELDAALWVCPHCGHHFAMRARSRIASLVDAGSFSEEAAELRSEDPLDFFDVRPYTERLAEAEMNTGLGEAMVIGQARTGRSAPSPYRDEMSSRRPVSRSLATTTANAARFMNM